MKIKEEDMPQYVRNLEEAELWDSLVEGKVTIKNGSRTKKDGTKNDVTRTRTFESARKAYFELVFEVNFDEAPSVPPRVLNARAMVEKFRNAQVA